MARKPEEMTEEITEEITEAAAPEAVPYDPWQDMRKVYIPRRGMSEQATLEVGVNDRTFFIPKDQFVDVPMPVWEAVHAMLDAEKVMDAEAKKDSGQREVQLGV